jgi:hypothetical protein
MSHYAYPTPLLPRRLAICALILVVTSLLPIAPASAASPYPAGATRPLGLAKRSDLAHAASAPTGGASAPTTGSSRSTTGSSKRTSKKRQAKPKPVLHGNAARALAAFETMQRVYYVQGSGLYQGEPFSYLWPFSQALAATVTMANVEGIAKIPGLKSILARELNARLVGLKSYLDTPTRAPRKGPSRARCGVRRHRGAADGARAGSKYYDDNDWVGIELVRMYKLTHQAALLGSAEGIMAFEMAGWQKPSRGSACPGASRSRTPRKQRTQHRHRRARGRARDAAVRADRQRQDLQFAEMAYEWVRSCLPSRTACTPTTSNRTAIRRTDGVELQPGHDDRRRHAALPGDRQRRLPLPGAPDRQGRARLLHPERLGSENPFFVSVYFRNLLYLDSVTHDPPGPQLAQNYVNYAWQHLRLSDDVFVAGSPPPRSCSCRRRSCRSTRCCRSPPSTYF